MKRKLGVVLLLLCLLLSACGEAMSAEGLDDLTDSTPEESNSALPTELNYTDINEVQASDRTYNISKIEIPNPNESLSTLPLPEYYTTGQENWGIVYGDVYRYINILDDISYAPIGSCIQILEAPYTEWESYYIAPEDWLEGEMCIPNAATITDYGEVYVMLENEEYSYIGKWTKSSDKLSTEVLNCKYPVFSHTNWCTGDSIGNFFLYNESYDPYILKSVWLDSDFQEEQYLPTNGYIWKAYETYYSGTPYFFGAAADAVSMEGNSMSVYNQGFSIWAEGEEEPVFTTPYVGMMYDDTALFTSDTEGFLFGYGIWRFSLEEQSIVKVRDDNRTWYDAYLQEDGSVLLLSVYWDPDKNIDHVNQFDYYLWEMTEQVIENE